MLPSAETGRDYGWSDPLLSGAASASDAARIGRCAIPSFPIPIFARAVAVVALHERNGVSVGVIGVIGWRPDSVQSLQFVSAESSGADAARFVLPVATAVFSTELSTFP